MRLTRRGGGAVAVAVGGFVLAATYGPRSLNAVVAPVLVALAAGVVQALWTDEPTVTRRKPAPGFPGETRTVELRVETGSSCTVRDGVDPGLRPVDEAGADLAGSGTVTYDVELVERGDHRLGPARVTVRDALGFVTREFEGYDRTPLLVYPEVRPVAGGRTFAPLVEQAGTPEREAFDRLREYTPGDALRDIDWKSSAKRTDDEFVVTEYAAEDEGGLSVVAEAEEGCDDGMATAAASVALYLLDARLTIGVVTPTGRVEQGKGDEHRERVLELLARAGHGRVGRGERREADVYVNADPDGVTVRVGSREVAFEELTEAPPEVVAA